MPTCSVCRATPSTPDEFETPNVTLALWQPEAEGVPFAPDTAGIALRVPNVEAARERLSRRGMETFSVEIT